MANPLQSPPSTSTSTNTISGDVKGSNSIGIVIHDHGGNVGVVLNSRGPLTQNGQPLDGGGDGGGVVSSVGNTMASNIGNGNGNGGGTNNGNGNGVVNFAGQRTAQLLSDHQHELHGGVPFFAFHNTLNNAAANGAPGFLNGNSNGNFNNNAIGVGGGLLWPPLFRNNWLRRWNRFWGFDNVWGLGRLQPQSQSTPNYVVANNGNRNGNGNGQFSGNFNGNANV